MEQAESIEATNRNFLIFFNTDQYPQYFNPVPFNKGFGFSIKRRYDARVLKLLPEQKEEEYEYLALFHIFIEDEELANSNKRKIVGIRAAMVVGKERLIIPSNPKINWPVELNSDDYSFDIETEKFYKNEKEIQPMVMLEQVYETHIKPCKKFKGFWFRTRKILQFTFAKFLKIISQLLNCLLFVTSGKTETWKFEKRFWEYSLSSKKEGSNVITQSKKVQFLGFEVSKQCLFLYCLLHLVIYFIAIESTGFIAILRHFHFFNLGKSALENPFISVAYAFVSLTIFEALLEKLLPNPIQRLVKTTTFWAMESQWRGIKI
ncbi:MAG: hypothetical protein WCS85_02175 [Candidatus Peribacteraceae bacterium]